MATGDSHLIVPVFLPHSGCPHRCVFCNQEAITGNTAHRISLSEIRQGIDTFLNRCRQTDRQIQIAFYGGNFLGLPQSDIRALLETATTFVAQGRVHGIRFSTRPDTIDRKRLDVLEKYPISTVELGAQSMDNDVLARAGRGHSARDTESAAARIKARNYALGLQLMVGLPGDTEARAMETAGKIAALAPDFIRIYPTVVLKGSPLSSLYARGRYTPWSLKQTVSVVKQMFSVFQAKNIAVIRMGLQATVDLDNNTTILAGPYHPAFGHLVLSEIYLDKAVATIKNSAMATDKRRGGHVEIRVRPADVSRMRGQKNENIHRLKQQFGFARIAVRTEPSLKEGQIVITNPI